MGRQRARAAGARGAAAEAWRRRTLGGGRERAGGAPAWRRPRARGRRPGAQHRGVQITARAASVPPALYLREGALLQPCTFASCWARPHACGRRRGRVAPRWRPAAPSPLTAAAGARPSGAGRLPGSVDGRVDLRVEPAVERIEALDARLHLAQLRGCGGAVGTVSGAERRGGRGRGGGDRARAGALLCSSTCATRPWIVRRSAVMAAARAESPTDAAPTASRSAATTASMPPGTSGGGATPVAWEGGALGAERAPDIVAAAARARRIGCRSCKGVVHVGAAQGAGGERLDERYGTSIRRIRRAQRRRSAMARTDSSLSSCARTRSAAQIHLRPAPHLLQSARRDAHDVAALVRATARPPSHFVSFAPHPSNDLAESPPPARPPARAGTPSSCRRRRRPALATAPAPSARRGSVLGWGAPA